MFRVFSCLTGEHDWRLVALAVLVSLLASLVSVSLFQRARAGRRRRSRQAWTMLAGAATGSGMWATHFIAMLAYRPLVAVGYDFGLTLASLMVAVVVTFVGFSVALSGFARSRALLGGAIVGAGVAVMHFLGMWALEVPGSVSWSADLVVASVLLGMGFATLSLYFATRRGHRRSTFIAAILLAFAILTHHFTAMGAVLIVPDPMLQFAPSGLSPGALAFTVAAAAVEVLGMCLIGALADGLLARRTQQFARVRYDLIAESKEQLREQNNRLDAALNNMTQGLCMFNANEEVVVFNRRFLEMYKLSPQVVRPGCKFRDLIQHRKEVGLLDADPETYYRGIIEDVRQGKSTTAMVKTTDGRLVQALNQPMPGGGWVTTHEDVTDRRRAEEQVREQKQQMDAALDNISQGLLMFGADARLILCNRRYLELYDLPPDTVKPGLPLAKLFALRKARSTLPIDFDAYRSELTAALDNNKPVTVISELADGRIIALKKHQVPDGRWVSTHEDITERRRTEAQVREQKLQMDAALDNISQGLLMFGADARLILCNRRYLELYGLPPDAVKPGLTLQGLFELRKAHGSFGRDPEEYAKLLSKALSEGSPIAFTPELADGRVMSIEHHPLPDGRWVSTHEDITKRLRAETQLREQKLQLDTAMNNMSQGLNMFDAAGRLVVCNERYLQMYGLSPDIVKPGCAVEDLVHARMNNGTFFVSEPQRYIGELMESMRRREANRTTMELPDGRIIAVISQPTPDGSGWVVTHEDITERRHTELERDRSKAFADIVIENVPSTIVLKDARTRRYALINRAGEEFFGVPRKDMIGKLAAEVFPEKEARVIAEHDLEILRDGEPQFYDERPQTTPSGDIRIATTSRVPIRDANGETQFLLTVIDDRTHRKRAEAEIARLVHYDVLTSLPNRTAFSACIDATIETAAAEHRSFALMSLDVDRFKEVNDVYGHAAGDEMLRQMSKRLQASVGGAFVARLGGDEFVVIATDGEQPATAEIIAERLVEALKEPVTLNGQAVSIGVSIGIAIFPVDAGESGLLVSRADAALYRAKADGRGTFRFFEAEMDQRLRDRRVLQQELRTAIENGELVLYYQPQARIDGTIIGFEALVRWQHPQRGLIAPDIFIPLAEESGLIVAMGEWIIREACRQAASWPRPLQIAVNLSPVQFRHGDLPGLVHTILLETGLPPSHLELEITEGVLIDDFSRAVATLRRLKSLGVRIAMDDFGTGYSSLSYLQSFPFDKIKIDKSFIFNLRNNNQSATIVRAVIGLARGLGVPVLAEGVETKEQLAFLTKESCDEIQGYLIGRPLPIENHTAMTGQPGKARAGAAAS